MASKDVVLNAIEQIEKAPSSEVSAQNHPEIASFMKGLPGKMTTSTSSGQQLPTVKVAASTVSLAYANEKDHSITLTSAFLKGRSPEEVKVELMELTNHLAFDNLNNTYRGQQYTTTARPIGGLEGLKQVDNFIAGIGGKENVISELKKDQQDYEALHPPKLEGKDKAIQQAKDAMQSFFYEKVPPTVDVADRITLLETGQTKAAPQKGGR